ncbi:vacuolar protein sorting-associated protein VTA1 homolog [Macrosteles quadrilineatus]|uniref:vacuolar protein sorting-associated protein VTA1 homolog n=1 Tax=Macrosteles quadrilineatus TaxID=74068 RepID=UPI0023E28317|nr:vacuolar protein sorting-associated protein VTA1 homolog [Macrosteles quadrilineatus]
MSCQLPPCPASLKPIQHYLKTAAEHDGRDPVISYWCRIYALQSALKLDKKSDEAKIMLMSLMDWLEKEKKRLSDNEAITNDVAAQAHIENYGLKLFLWADGQDRAGQFNKNVVKAFYTAGFLMDVLNTFGEQTDEIQQNCKYAKWKAAYIHNCLRNGEMPVPGPVGGDEEGAGATSGYNQPSLGFDNISQPSQPTPPPSDSPYNQPSNSNAPSYDSIHYPTPSNEGFHLPTPPSGPGSYHNLPQPPPSQPHPSPSPSPAPPTPQPTPATYNPPRYDPAAIDPALLSNPSTNVNGVKLQPEQISKAQKYCKWAGSALSYDDVPEAVMNLQKALKLLTTGVDS